MESRSVAVNRMLWDSTGSMNGLMSFGAPQAVLPRACARQALIAAHAHQQVHGVPADRRVHEPAAPRGTHAAGRAALRAAAGRVVPGLAADQLHARARTLPLMPLPDRDQPQPVEAGQTRASNAPDSIPSRAVFFILSITH